MSAKTPDINGGVEFPVPVGWADSPAAVSMAVWCRITDTSPTNAIVGRHNASSAGWHLRIRTGGNFQVQLNRATTSCGGDTTDAPIITGEWMCLAGSLNTVGTAFAATGTLNRPMTLNAGSFAAGSGTINSHAGLPVKLLNRGSAGVLTTGAVGEVAVAAFWERALTLKELTDWQLEPFTTQRHGMKFLCAPHAFGDEPVNLIDGAKGAYVGSCFPYDTPGFITRLPLLRWLR